MIFFLGVRTVRHLRIWNPRMETCLLKHEIALYTESTEAVCGKSDCLTPLLLHVHFITY